VSQPWPLELRLKDEGQALEIDFEGGASFRLPAEYLRVESPSAEVQGHGPSQKQLVSGVAGIAVIAVEPVGNYAVRLRFADGHDTGIYSWPYLHQLGAEQPQRWQAYLAALAAAGRSRTSKA
jgi:DUF971 family protein